MSDDPNRYLSPHFKAKEFACRCGCGFGPGDGDVDAELLVVLEETREHFDAPITINSGCRCLSHNRNVGSTDKSQHVKGTAADIRVSGVAPSVVHGHLTEFYPDEYGIGGYSSFTHIDVRDHKARW